MRVLFILILCITANDLFAQFGVSFHQSNLPFVGFNYEIKGRFLPELRIGMDQYADNLSVEAVGTYQFLDKDAYEAYAGIGGRVVNTEGIVTPVGLNLFPFAAKSFGFHIEVCPIFVLEDTPIIRGSWGIRYRFLK